MDTAIGALRSVGVIFVVVAVAFGTYIHQVARITASGAAMAAATAAAHPSTPQAGTAPTPAPVGGRGRGGCPGSRGPHRGQLGRHGHRLLAGHRSRMHCGGLGARRGRRARTWLEATAVACRPTRAAGATGWALAPTC